MIINSIISGKKESKIVTVTTDKKFFFENIGDEVSISFVYHNSLGLDAKAIFYVDGQEVMTESEVNEVEISWDVTEYLTSPKLYMLKVIFVDSEGNSNRIDFMVLAVADKENYNFQYVSLLNGYQLVSYSGVVPNIFVPEYFDDGINGIKYVVRIVNGAFFNNNSLQEIFIPGSIQSIGTNAFFSCTNLIKVTVNREVPPILESSTVFDPYNQLSLLKIHVPSGSVNDYKTAQFWNEYFNSIVAIQ
jgi:hypothetical protein